MGGEEDAEEGCEERVCARWGEAGAGEVGGDGGEGAFDGVLGYAAGFCAEGVREDGGEEGEVGEGGGGDEGFGEGYVDG